MRGATVLEASTTVLCLMMILVLKEVEEAPTRLACHSRGRWREKGHRHRGGYTERLLARRWAGITMAQLQHERPGAVGGRWAGEAAPLLVAEDVGPAARPNKRRAIVDLATPHREAEGVGDGAVGAKPKRGALSGWVGAEDPIGE